LNDFRQIDVLNEVAFLCMDLDALGRHDLSDLFIDQYNQLFPAMRTRGDKALFIYYKSYRANVRAKVNSLRAKSAGNTTAKTKALSEVDKYLRLMNGYLRSLQSGSWN
jgi:aminoglycoside phosphotransferase family enzyme